MSVLRDCRKRGGVKILLTTASLAIRNSAQFVFIRANRGKQPRRIGNTHAQHCRVLALGMQTHINDTVGLSQTSMQTWAHVTDKRVC